MKKIHHNFEAPKAEHVKSGDFFGVIRLDGLDPFLGWAMGSTTGHVTVALWMDGDLYVCESTTANAHWPTNGIQRTPYNQWLQQAKDAGYNVVFAPLNEKQSKAFNEENAKSFFLSTQGLDYGYYNMFWGLIDTMTDNYPCLPLNSGYDGDGRQGVCIQWELLEVLFGTLDRQIPYLSNMFWNQAFNLRLSTVGESTANLFYNAFTNKGIISQQIPFIPEQDSFMYQTTRDGVPASGRSMVCCVFVCSIWKSAGVFATYGLNDDQINCSEFTNVNDYALNIFSTEKGYKQIIGDWSLELNRFHTKDPYEHMNQACASLSPEYTEDPLC